MLSPLQILPYSNWQNCLRLANAKIELIATIDVGPRIIRFGFIGKQNEFAEYPEQVGLTGGNTYRSYGGHRLWAAPEIKGWTNHPDNNPVEWKDEKGRVTLTAHIEEGTRLQKQLYIHLSENQNHVQVIHRITNHSDKNLTLAPWAISVMSVGGRVIVPQESYIPHSEQVLPVRPLVLWGYTEMQDTRWTWGNRFIQLRQNSDTKTVQKFGALITQGWAAYINNEHVFIKRFPYFPEKTYSDYGCNAEFFTNQRMLEIESLGPLITLQPEDSVTHEENWFLFRGITLGTTDDEIEKTLTPLIQQCKT